MRHPAHLLALVDADGALKRLERIEAEAIAYALAHCQGNAALAARALGVGRGRLYRKHRDAMEAAR